ncbi:MAG: hypothetical protein P1U63_07110 [Coxiellaceae bacterium]|nr:hypothetical protein [Coxiellaceae bacterium]
MRPEELLLEQAKSEYSAGNILTAVSLLYQAKTADSAIAIRLYNGDTTINSVFGEPAASTLDLTAALAERDNENLFNVAQCYLVGLGVEKNKQQAIALFKEAAAQEHADSQCELGMLYLRGEADSHLSPYETTQKAIQLHKAAIRNNSIHAATILFSIYIHHGEPQHAAAALAFSACVFAINQKPDLISVVEANFEELEGNSLEEKYAAASIKTLKTGNADQQLVYLQQFITCSDYVIFFESDVMLLADNTELNNGIKAAIANWYNPASDAYDIKSHRDMLATLTDAIKKEIHQSIDIEGEINIDRIDNLVSLTQHLLGYLPKIETSNKLIQDLTKDCIIKLYAAASMLSSYKAKQQVITAILSIANLHPTESTLFNDAHFKEVVLHSLVSLFGDNNYQLKMSQDTNAIKPTLIKSLLTLAESANKDPSLHDAYKNAALTLIESAGLELQPITAPLTTSLTTSSALFVMPASGSSDGEADPSETTLEEEEEEEEETKHPIL